MMLGRFSNIQGDDDIYEFVENEPLTLDCIQEISGTVRDRISNEVLAGATVKIIDEENNEISSTITDSNGNYILQLDCSKGNFVRASRDGYVPAEEYLPISDGKPRIVDFYLERDTVTGGFGDDLAKLLQLSTIYFDLNKYNSGIPQGGPTPSAGPVFIQVEKTSRISRAGISF